MLARNSTPSRTRCAENVAPLRSSRSKWTRLPVGSHEKARAAIFVGKPRPPVNRHAAGRRKRARVRIGRRDVGADRIQPGAGAVSLERLGRQVDRAVLHRFRKCQVRISLEYLRREHDVLHLHAVVADEPPPEIVERQSELCAAVGRFVLPWQSRPPDQAERNRKSVRPNSTAGRSGRSGDVTLPPVSPLVR